MNRLLTQLLSFTILLCYATPASACSICVMAFFDYYLPPLFAWLLFPIAWFIFACHLSHKNKTRQWGLPTTGRAFLIGICMFVFAIVTGLVHVVGLFLLIPPVVLAINCVNPKKRTQWSKQEKRKNCIVSLIGTLSFVALISATCYILSTRTKMAYLEQWGTSGMGRTLVGNMQKNPDDNVDKIRAILLNDKIKSYVGDRLARTLGRHGDPVIDFPVLLHVLKRTGGDPDVHDALETLTGIELPNEATAKEWETAFEKKYIEKNE